MTELPTLPAFIAERLSAPRPVALAERRDGRTIALSAAGRHARAAAVAHALRARGIGRGDRVAILANNSVEWLVADFGILYAGGRGRADVRDDRGRPDRVHPRRQRGEARVRRRRRVRGAHPRRGAERAAARRARGRRRAVRSRSSCATGEARAADEALLRSYHDGIAPDDLAVLIYTSGTTGQPKGVMLSHRNLVSDVTSAFDPAASGLPEGEIGLSVLPFAHIFEHTNALGYLYNRLIHYVTTPERLLADMRAIRPNYVAFVPRIFERLIAGIIGKRARGRRPQSEARPVGARGRHRVRARGARRKARAAAALAARARKAARARARFRPMLGLDRLEYFVSGSAPLHRDTALTLAAMGVPVLEGYGLTETSPVVTVNRPARQRARYRRACR